MSMNKSQNTENRRGNSSILAGKLAAGPRTGNKPDDDEEERREKPGNTEENEPASPGNK